VAALELESTRQMDWSTDFQTTPRDQPNMCRHGYFGCAVSHIYLVFDMLTFHRDHDRPGNVLQRSQTIRVPTRVGPNSETGPESVVTPLIFIVSVRLLEIVSQDRAHMRSWHLLSSPGRHPSIKSRRLAPMTPFHGPSSSVGKGSFVDHPLASI
jgi:hypothetical protein